MSLVIENLHSRFHSAVALDPARCDAWQAALADADGDALCAGLTGADEWLLIRRLPLTMRWRADAPDAEVGRHWHQSLRQALEQASAQSGSTDHADIIRYASRRAALADLLYRSALGDCRRQWAWQRMGLLSRSGLSAAVALAEATALLLREPELIWPVLHRLLAAETATAALTALLHALPATSWQALLLACPRTAPYAEIIAVAHGSATLDLPAGGAAATLLRWAAARPHFAARHVNPLTILIAALAWPMTPRGSSVAHARAAALVARLGSISGKRAAPAVDAGVITVPAAKQEENELPSLPALPEQVDWRPTRCGGALFWLGRVPAAELLAWLESIGQPNALPLLLRAIAAALGVPADDAAMTAFCGGEVPHQDMPAALQAHAVALVAGWRAWLDQQAPDLPPPRMTAVCQRSGRLRLEPGWIELHLPMDSADTRLRRLGLDLDPGWLPWLGCVVRIVYDE